jgi:hypothetical protein
MVHWNETYVTELRKSPGFFLEGQKRAVEILRIAM